METTAAQLSGGPSTLALACKYQRSSVKRRLCSAFLLQNYENLQNYMFFAVFNAWNTS